MLGRVINLNGGVYKVILDDDTLVSVKARGALRHQKVYASNDKSKSNKKNPSFVKNSPKVGDIVEVKDGFIDHFKERKNSLIRPDIANVDNLMLIISAKSPDISYYLLDVFLMNALKNNINPVIVVTKIDMLSDSELIELKNNMKYYESLGYKTFLVNNMTKEGISDVTEFLETGVTILSGQTGAGKSSTINSIIPDFTLETQEISKALGRGKHTTREITLYPFNGGFIGDTPGFSKLDMLGIKLEDINELFVEFKNCSCKFNDCNHGLNALGCGVREKVNNNEILKSRYDNYLKLYLELKEK